MSSLLPPNATIGERSMALSTSRVSGVPSPLRDLWDSETCPIALLPWLAWTLSVDTWDSAWTESTKRSVVRLAVSTARAKGTKKSVKDALDSIGTGSVLTEWFETSPAGSPHTFTITIAAQDVSESAQALMRSEIDRTKPLRSSYEIVFGAAGSASINIVGVLRATSFVRLDGVATY